MNLYAVRYNFFDWNLFINIDLFFLLKSYVIRLLKFRLQRPGNTAMLNVILLGLIWSLLRNLKISCLFPTTVMFPTWLRMDLWFEWYWAQEQASVAASLLFLRWCFWIFLVFSSYVVVSVIPQLYCDFFISINEAMYQLCDYQVYFAF